MNKNTHLQYLLAQYGFYTGKIDGIIGAKSNQAISTANTYFNIPVTEGVTDRLIKCLMTFVKFNRTLRLNAGEFFNEPVKKDEFVIHHTAGWVVDKHGKNNMNFFADWNNSPNSKIATAYSIGYDGTIYEHYNPINWSYHLGMSTAGSLQKTKESIGVELSNEGALSKDANGEWKFWAGKYNRPQDIPIEHAWRGEKFWAPYSADQMLSVCKLTAYVHFRYDVPLAFSINALDYLPEIVDRNFKGVYSHGNVRKDKTDVSPAFPWHHFVSKSQEFVREINTKFESL